MTRRLPALARKGVGAALALALVFVLADRLFPFPWQATERAPARRVVDRKGRVLRVLLPADGRIRFPVTLEDLPNSTIATLLALEDSRFYWHPGVDPLAVVRASWSNLRAGRVVSGASTITMQVARMCAPRRRTIGAKLIESFRALQLEWHLSKDEILEIYLYLAPYGGNIEGIEAASELYFGLPASRLSLAETALLSVLPRAPNSLDPIRHPVAAQKARAADLLYLSRHSLISRQEAREASARPLPTRRRDLPFHAPHFARDIARRHPLSPLLETTLDLDLQRIAERQVTGRLATLRDQGIENAAVVVIENETRAIRALVGSAGFHEEGFAGQINGALAERSPGSTLKPFLFGLAFDKGMALPSSYLLDIPTDFAGYIAKNYDGEYRGQVETRFALAQSLNAPAVRLLARVGVPAFLGVLRAGGLGTLSERPGLYGLPLALGGGEVRLLDLTNLYATLARDGKHREIRWLEHREPGPETRLLSSDSVHQVASILTEMQRPDLPQSWRMAPDAPAASWKTGTSRGHRDAWSIGFTHRWTIGVWVGSFSGMAHHGMSGAVHASPLLFDLLRSLDPGGEPSVQRHRVLPQVDLCAVSRQLPRPFCRQRARAETAATTLHLGLCEQHRRIHVDRETGFRLAGDCLAGRAVDTLTVTIDPPPLAVFRRSLRLPVRELPPFSPDCSVIAAEEPPRILSPDPATPYLLQSGLPPNFQRIPLLARSASGVQRLFWYQQGLLVAAGAPNDQLFLDPVQGIHRLVVVDDRGRSSWLDYRVE